MGIEKILRPMRLTQRFPDAKGFLPGLSQAFGSECIISEAGMQLFQSQGYHFNEWINGARMLLPVTERKKWVGQLYECYDEVARVAAFRAYGQQAFLLSKEVVTELSKTSVGDIRLTDLHLPYSCCYVALEVPLPFGGPNEVLEGAYFRSAGKRIDVTVCTRKTDASWPAWAIDPAYGIELASDDEECLLADAVDRQIQRSLARGVNLREGLERSAKEAQPLVDFQLEVMPSVSQERQATELEAKKASLIEAMALLANVICLLTAMPEEVVGPQQWLPAPVQNRPGTSHKMERGSLQVRKITFGNSSSSHSGVRTEGAATVRAHWRRGHWRRTPYGPKGSSYYQPKWIRPVLVNPQNGGMAEHSEYSVGDRI